MLVENALNKLSKYGKIQRTDYGKYWAVIGHYEVSFLVNGQDGPDAEITCEELRRIGVKDDLQSDYFAGTFCDSLTQAIRWAQDWTARDLASPTGVH